MKKKWITMFLTAIMLLTLLPTVIFAADNSAYVDTKKEFLDALGDATVTTINITADIDLTDIPAGAGQILDLSGRTIDLGGNKITANNFALIYEGSNFTIQNGTFDSNGGAYALFIGDGPTSNVLVQNITAIGGINVYNSLNVVLRNVDITGSSYYAVWCDNGGQVKIESGTFQTNGNAVLGMVDNNADNHFDSGATLNITGGTFHTNGKPLVLEAAGINYGDPVISGGTFDCSAKEYVAEELKFESNSAGTYTYHETFQDAIKNADSNTIITAVDTPSSGGSSYIATLVYNDGSGKSVQFAANTEGSITLPSIDRSGYLFLGWDNGNGRPIAANQTYTLRGNETLTGRWKELTKVKTAAKAATCTENGNIAYWYCPELNAYFKNEALTEEILLEDTIIPATGHGETNIQGIKTATCTETGYTGDKVCTTCGKIVEKGKSIAKTAHTYENGTCSVCGMAAPNVEPEPIPTDKPNELETESPQTGDSSPIQWGWLAAASIVGAVLCSKKKAFKR
ncbi:MAG: pectate lyase-like adhesive domain-containing protein [Oscillospiraceae bacterium]|jgi:hypothetical protein